MNKFLRKYNKMKNEKGFSLVELMVVVAGIIGILASIAIPSYQKFQRRARQAEPKTMLSSIYTAQVAFIAEYGLGSPNLLQIGITPSGQVQYLTGFALGDNSLGSSTTLDINKKARITGYRGPLAVELDHTHTFNICEGGTGTAMRSSCNVPLGALNNTKGTALAATDVKGGCQMSGNTGGCTFDPVAKTCVAATVTSPITVCTPSDTGVGNIARNTVTFTIGSIGNIGGTNDDQWIMDEVKNLTNVQNGVD